MRSGLQHVTAPIGRQRHVAGKFCRHFVPPLFQRRAVGDHVALVRCPGGKAAAARTALEIRLRFRLRQFRDRAGDADLPFQIRPVKRQRRIGIFGQFQPLAAVIIREKNKAAFVHTFEQHGAG